MRIVTPMLAAFLLSVAALPAPVLAQPSTVPHAFLFGTWAGGLLPVPDGALAQACRTPTVAFGKDAVAHATLMDPRPLERVIATVRKLPSGVDITFAPADQRPSPTGLTPDPGFGCETPDVLHVNRDSANQISFPGCSAFPSPLLRCQVPSR